jgi:multimeric flavodoxin WrbA
MSGKHVLILKGSPREKGNSSLLADQVADGARAAGAEVESFDLHSMDIRPCDACDACQGTDADCIIEDDMQTLYPKLRSADAIVVASPIYWFTMSAQTKLCIDRWYALEGPQGNALAGKQIGIVLTYGDTDPFTSGAINAIRTFQDMFRYVKANIVGIVYGSASKAGEIQNQQELMERAFKLGRKLADAQPSLEPV